MNTKEEVTLSHSKFAAIRYPGRQRAALRPGPTSGVHLKKIFVTSANGFVGAVVLQNIIVAGRQMLGLSLSWGGAIKVTWETSIVYAAAPRKRTGHPRRIHLRVRKIPRTARSTGALSGRWGDELTGSGRPFVSDDGSFLPPPGYIGPRTLRRLAPVRRPGYRSQPPRLVRGTCAPRR